MTTHSDLERAPSGRAKTIPTLATLLGKLATPEGVVKGLAMPLRPSDVVISPFGKSGTTWLQQIAHTLRTRGDMDFDDISAVVPWLEMSTDLGLDLQAEQRAAPRVFKSHLDAHRIPKGGRYIISARDPLDAAYSMYKFMEGWFLEPGAVTPDDFVRALFLSAGMTPGSERGDYWTHLHSWWLRRNDPDVLFLAFEQTKTDLTGTIRRVADFMGIELDDALLAITKEHASLEFMQRHKDRFDDKLMRERSVVVAGLPVDSDSAKVRSGQVGESRQRLSMELAAEFDAVWHKRIEAELGFENYAAMIATLP